MTIQLKNMKYCITLEVFKIEFLYVNIHNKNEIKNIFNK